MSCCCYHKGTYFQANHNFRRFPRGLLVVVVATTKVHIFKQITTYNVATLTTDVLLLLPQRYIFSSKSQPIMVGDFSLVSCCCYHKGTYFQANHNVVHVILFVGSVVVATTKVHIFKQITTGRCMYWLYSVLLLLPQRYIFSSKSQHGRDYQDSLLVVVATTKVHIFKQITTGQMIYVSRISLLLLPQRYIFSSKSQHH